MLEHFYFNSHEVGRWENKTIHLDGLWWGESFVHHFSEDI